MRAPRPIAIPIVVAFLFTATLISVLVGISLLFPNALLGQLWELNRPAEPYFRALGRASGILLLILGAATLAAGIGLLQRKRWAWLFAVVLFAVNGLGDAISAIVTLDWLRSAAGVGIAAAFLFAFLHSGVRRYFRLAVE